MCTQTHPPVDRDLKLAPRAKLFIDGKTRPLFVTDQGVDVKRQLDDATVRTITVTNLNGEATTIRKRKVVSVVEVRTDRHRVEIDEGVFSGRQIRLRDYAAWRDEARDASGLEVWDEYPFPAVVVLGEDLAETAVLVARPTGEALWINPANPDGATERYSRIVRLAAQAETLVAQEYAPGDDLVAATNAEPELREEDLANAEAHLEAGNVVAAVGCAGPAFVTAFLAECVVQGEVHGIKVNGRAFRVLGAGSAPTTLAVRQPVGDESDDTEDTVIDVAEISTVKLPI